jgi:glycosyltransferase involved in cell wall biosynthesis
LHASQFETYGMVVTEALAHGVPVVATCVGGVREAMGLASDGRRPGWLVPPGDPAAFAGAIRGWLEHSEQRAELRAAALDRRQTLTPWATTAGQVAYALRAASERLEVPA